MSVNRKRFNVRRALVAGIVLAIVGLGLLSQGRAATGNADLNGDGRVNITDVSILLTNYGQTGTAGDIDGDGKVTIYDLNLLLSAYGKPVSVKLPGQILNLKDWYLTLPTGSPDTVNQPALNTYSSKYFQVNAAKNGVVFMAPVSGSTTSNSDHTRSELRETAADGSLPWGWPTGSGSHTLTATESIEHLPSSSGKIGFAQIHGPDSTWYLILMATGTGNGTATLTVKDATGKADGKVIASSYKLGTKFNLTLAANNGTVTIAYNGKTVVSTTNNMSDDYFKIGCYNQSDGDYGQDTVYSLAVTHK